MVNLFKKIKKDFSSFLNYRRCKRAIKEADRRAVTTGKKQLVLMYDGKPIVVSKQRLKELIRTKHFAKGFTPAKAESLAIYTTK